MAARDTNKPDTTKPDEAEAAPEPANTDPQRIVIEQAPAEPAVYYDGEHPNAANPNKPHVKARYEPFVW